MMSEYPTTQIDEHAGDGDHDERRDDGAADRPVEHGELLEPGTDGQADDEVQTNSVTEPAKVMRIGSMVKQLLDEVRHAPLDQASRERLAEIYERSVAELSEALSPDLQEELRSLALPFEVDNVPTDSRRRCSRSSWPPASSSSNSGSSHRARCRRCALAGRCPASRTAPAPTCRASPPSEPPLRCFDGSPTWPARDARVIWYRRRNHIDVV